jgi:hypothetical protein
MQDADAPATRNLARVCFKNILAKMLGMGMAGLVDRDRNFVMVERDMDVKAGFF